MTSKPVLRLDWCSHQAAKYAVEHWHYARKLPFGKLAKVGVWEGGQFIGAIVFSYGANHNMGRPFRLGQTSICELTRVALFTHVAPVSRIVALSIRFLRALSPDLRLIVSYADPAQNHHGGIYQALGWPYTGTSTPQRELRVAGVFMHKRVASLRWGTASPERLKVMTGLDVEYGPVEWKHTYLYPLDDAMRAQIAPLAKPYPKRPRAGSIAVDATPFHGGEGGSSPTPALHAEAVS